MDAPVNALGSLLADLRALLVQVTAETTEAVLRAPVGFLAGHEMGREEMLLTIIARIERLHHGERAAETDTADQR